MSSSTLPFRPSAGNPDDGIYLLISREDLDHAGAYRCPSRRPPPLAWLGVAAGLCKVVGLGCGIRGLVGASDGNLRHASNMEVRTTKRLRCGQPVRLLSHGAKVPMNDS